MGYMHIDNLYKSQDILLFRECYALEKIHGTSAWISYRSNNPDDVYFHHGGCKQEVFAGLFDKGSLVEKFKSLGYADVTIYGEAYGGKIQKMSETYGKDVRFVAFDVKVGDNFLDVPDAEEVSAMFGVEFVSYNKISTDMSAIDAERDSDSVQAIRNGIGAGKAREGVVLRPLHEVKKKNGNRIIAKHKNDEFSETKTPRKVDEKELEVMRNANMIAEEWVTHMRLSHVLQSFPEDVGIEKTGDIIRAMLSDVEREAEGEVEMSKEARKAIGSRTAQMFKARLVEHLYTHEGE